MDQQELHALEKRCVHDAPPPCTARCPVRVDVRGLLGAVAAGRFDDGLRLLAARVPFRAIVCRVCEEPCREECPRGVSGGSLRVRDAEASCVEYGVLPRARRAPARRGRVAVVGGGLSGATAAHDLALKGYDVRLFEATERLGGRLWEMEGEQLPGETIIGELRRSAEAGVRIEYDRVIDTLGLERLSEEHDAVCLACGPACRVSATLAVEVETLSVDPSTLATGVEGLFVAGVAQPADSRWSPITAVADGRRAATSIDRHLRGVSLTAGRVDETRAESPTVSSRGRVEPLPTVSPADAQAGYTAHEASAEAARCLQCGCRECIDACPYLAHYGSTPKTYLREINNNLLVSPGMGYRASKGLINSCRLCGLCAEVCPSGIDMGMVCLEARRELQENGSMPPAVHELLLRDVAFCNGESFALARHQAGFGGSRYAFFPGCQLPASRPDETRAAYEHLAGRLDGGVALILGCCGAPAEWAGRVADRAGALDGLARAWSKLGRPELIVACASCARLLRAYRPEIRLVSLWEILADLGVPASGRELPPLAVHDPCAARHNDCALDATRRLLDQLGCDHRDLPHARRLTECCGFGGLQGIANPELQRDSMARQVAADPRDFVTSCAMCRDQFASAGKRSWHLLDLLFGAGDPVRAATRGPTWSERRTERSRFKKTLLRDLWSDLASRPTAGNPGLVIPDALRLRLDRELILESDVAAVIAAAEAGGARLVDRESGHRIACARPASVTYWVEYSRRADGAFTVHTAMAIASRSSTMRRHHRGATDDPPLRGLLTRTGGAPCAAALSGRHIRGRGLLACPRCGQVYVTEELARGRIRDVEMSFEDK